MFGVVPRNLWAQVCPPDDQNRIRLNMNCVFVDTGDEKVLIETGIGDKWTPRETAMYGIDRQRSLSETLQAKTGVSADKITIVINTHLHFDHAGGNTTANVDGNVVPTFKNARYFVSAAELEHADAPSERDRASYLKDNWGPLRESGQLEAKEADYEVVPGLRMQTEPGHNRSMQCWRLDRGNETVFGFADLVPMRAHIRGPWIMGYDLFPLETLEAKKRLLPKAIEENWLCLFYHDPDAPLCRIAIEDGKFKTIPFEV
jgi:glyoxylase-like metal-dependent hydrolase (beta-lactamase superfamily II)